MSGLFDLTKCKQELHVKRNLQFGEIGSKDLSTTNTLAGKLLYECRDSL